MAELTSTAPEQRLGLMAREATGDYIVTELVAPSDERNDVRREPVRRSAAYTSPLNNPVSTPHLSTSAETFASAMTSSSLAHQLRAASFLAISFTSSLTSR